MLDVIFIGNRADATLFRRAGIESFAPAHRHLAERVIAERSRCRVLAMTEATLDALPETLARDLRESQWPRLELLSPPRAPSRIAQITQILLARAADPVAGLPA